jgi:O-methyltransferase
MKPHIAAFIGQIEVFTVLDEVRLESLVLLCESLIEIPGDIVECGTASGGSAAMLAWASGRHCWLYDSCKGLPEPSNRDPKNAWDYVGANPTTPKIIAAAFRIAGLQPSQYTLREGWFKDTFKEPGGPESIALLHIDADWYDSVKLCLERWYDAVSSGGIIVLDDYGYWSGCREAYDEFCRERKIEPTLYHVSSQAWWRKS